MLKNIFIISSISTLPIINQFIKTKIYKTNVYKQTVEQAIKQLNSIGIKFLPYDDIEGQKLAQYSKQANKQARDLDIKERKQQFLFNQITDEENQKMLSKKIKNRIQAIKQMSSDRRDILLTNGLIALVHTAGALLQPPFFYYSALLYCTISQISLINDLYSLKKGQKIFSTSFKTIGDLYLKVVAAGFLLITAKRGVQKIAQMTQTKQIIIKKDS